MIPKAVFISYNLHWNDKFCKINTASYEGNTCFGQQQIVKIGHNTGINKKSNIYNNVSVAPPPHTKPKSYQKSQQTR
jgi:hypothetical protein